MHEHIRTGTGKEEQEQEKGNRINSRYRTYKIACKNNKFMLLSILLYKQYTRVVGRHYIPIIKKAKYK